MTERAFEQLLERYYANVPEPQGGLAAGRVRLLDAAAQHRERVRVTQTLTRKEKKPKMKLLLATRLISAILAAVIGTAAVGGGVTWAASDSLPGDVLYPVKLAGEDLRLSLASTPESQVELALQFADERVAELEALVERGSLTPETVVARMEHHLFRAMNQAAWASEEEMPGLLKRIAQRTQVQAQTLQQLQLRTRAQTQNQAQLQNAHRICQRAQEEATAGLGDPQTFRTRYQHRNSMPEDVTPPEPPTREPQNGGPGPHGPGGPDDPAETDENQMDSSQDEQPGDPSQDRQGDQQQDRDREQDREDDPQQDRDRDREQDREDDPQQDRDRDREQDREDDPQQDQDRDREQDRQGDPQQAEEHNQQQEQQPDQERDQQQDPQHDGQQGATNGSSGPGA
jgi:hypothetical protein